MAKSEKNETSLFVVSLEGLNLSTDQKKKIEEAIRSIVLSEVAKIDLKGDLKLSRRFTENPSWKELWQHGQLAGFLIEGFPDFPTGGPSGR